MSPRKPAPYFQQSAMHKNPKEAFDAAIQSHIARMGPSMLVRVEAVHAGGVSLTGSVDVQPMVHQQDALTRSYPRQPIHNVPYLRIQGGTSALIVDPKPGDIGFIIVAGRDMTHAITNRAPSPPASFRQHALEDCVYVGGFLNNGPDQFIQATAEGWRIVTPGSISITAGGEVSVQADRLHANCDIVTEGDIQAGSVSLKKHVHAGVQPGGGMSGAPQ